MLRIVLLIAAAVSIFHLWLGWPQVFLVTVALILLFAIEIFEKGKLAKDGGQELRDELASLKTRFGQLSLKVGLGSIEREK